MPMLYRRLLDRATLSPGATAALSQALDLGEVTALHFVLTVHEAGDGDAPILVVKHAAVNEEDAYLAFDTPAERALSSAGATWVASTSFTRWVCWFVSGTLATDATVSLDLVAKG